VESKSFYDFQELALSLVEFLLATFRIEKALFEADGNSIQVPDLLDHSVRRTPELAGPPPL